MKTLLNTWLLLSGLLFGSMAHAGGLMADNAWVRAAPPGATVMAAYMVLHNHGEATQLTGVSSDAFASIDLHRTVIEKDMARMEAVPALDLPMHGMVTLEPNGLHLMLMNPKAAFKAGDKVELTLQFANGETLAVSAEVRAGDMDADGADPHAHHHHPH